MTTNNSRSAVMSDDGAIQAKCTEADFTGYADTYSHDYTHDHVDEQTFSFEYDSRYSEEIKAAVAGKSRAYFFFKRCFDLVASLIAVVVLLIPFLIVMLAIFIEDGHSPFFVQERVTKDGKLFKMIKFRSMKVGAENMLNELQNKNEMDGPVFKIKDDPRITKVGSFIRRMSIDELPQLFNIIAGSMSIVGPRPPLPREVANYGNSDYDRLAVKGGLTCFWQAGGRNDINFDEWVELDRKYIREMSVWTDIKLIFMTVKAVLTANGAM